MPGPIAAAAVLQQAGDVAGARSCRSEGGLANGGDIGEAPILIARRRKPKLGEPCDARIAEFAKPVGAACRLEKCRMLLGEAHTSVVSFANRRS